MPELFGCLAFLTFVGIVAYMVRAARWLHQIRDAGDQLAEKAYIDHEIQHMEAGLSGTSANREGR